MCNPTQSPTKASSQSSSRTLPPPSPASTNTNSRMFSSAAAAATASPASRNTTTPSSANRIANHHHSNNTNAVAPILKLVTSLRNSEDRLIRSSPSRDAVNSTATTNSSLRRIIVRRPGQESRDDSQSDLLGGNHSTPPPGQFRPIQAQHQDEDDEIPSLIDEDNYGRYSSPVDVAFVNDHNNNDHQDDDDGDNPNLGFGPSMNHQRRALSLPKQQQQQQPCSAVQEPPPTAVKTDCTSGEATMPFFVLDWMLEDLVPDHQNAQDLANLLKESSRASHFSPLRKSKSCGIVGLNNAINNSNNSKSNAAFGKNSNRAAASPILQRFLPWSKVASEPRKATKPVNTYRPATPPTKDAGIPPMPITPKSSNRKNSKQRQKERRESLNIEAANAKGQAAAAHDDLALLVPRNLHDSLEDAKAPNDKPAPSPLRKFMPRVTSSPPVQAPPSNICPEDSWVGPNNSNNSNSKAATKKSASCPQLCQDSPELRQRAKEQHDRRERRNKLTVVQRSLTLAQGWNNKGLSMAGNATRAEQYHHQHDDDHESPQQQQPQNAPEHWWESSLECWDNALEIYRSLLGEYHERVADVQNNRGIALGKLGRFDEALLALGMALEARKKQEQRSKSNNNNESSPSKQEPPSSESHSAPASAAIVSTLHNIANVFRDAGNPSEALRVLVEAQATLRDSELVSKEESYSLYHRHHCWHQSARLSTAIGHVHYESKSWRDARDSYGHALEIYERLGRSLSRQSEALGWGGKQSSSKTLSTGDPKEAKRLELLHHQQLIQREVSVLEKDLDELDRSQQAKDGSRARLLQARKQQQQQQMHRKPKEQHRSQQQQQPQQQTLFGIVSSLRA